MVGLIVARSKNNVIGKNGQIPWRITYMVHHFWCIIQPFGSIKNNDKFNFPNLSNR